MIKLNVGCNFDPGLLDVLSQLNAEFEDVQIGELYGSVNGLSPVMSARPAFRLPTVAEGDFRAYALRALAMGMPIAYTINVSYVDQRQLFKEQDALRDFAIFLQDCGVHRAIVAHPLVAEVLEGTGLRLRLSTILQYRHPRQLEQIKARCPSVDSICFDVFINRDKTILGEMSAACKELGVEAEVLANEFCIYECPDRNQCYDTHAQDLDRNEVRIFKGYPMGRCIGERIRKPIEWLWARSVLPQHMQFYAERFGIKSFKVTGRTHPTSYIARVARVYMSKHFAGNLLELWADVENIGKEQDQYREPRYTLDAGEFADGLLDFYFGGAQPTAAEEQAFLERKMGVCRG